MYTLAFDTTVNFCSIGLYHKKTKIDYYQEEMTFGQSEVLMPEIKKLLEGNNLTFQQLDLVVVCTGPGSFTGVRSSIAAARTFGLACPHMVITGISAFDAYAADLTEFEKADANVVLIETKREDFYVQYYDAHLSKTVPAMTALYDDIVHALQGKKVTLTGDGVERFLNKPSGLSLHTVKMHKNPPLDNLALCGIVNYLNNKTDFPKPIYLKAPDVFLK